MIEMGLAMTRMSLWLELNVTTGQACRLWQQRESKIRMKVDRRKTIVNQASTDYQFSKSA